VHNRFEFIVIVTDILFSIRFLVASLLLLAYAYGQVEGVEQQYFSIQLVQQSRSEQGVFRKIGGNENRFHNRKCFYLAAKLAVSPSG
jgi:hypothetical protein